MRGLLIKGLSATEVNTNDLDDYYRLMDIDCIDIVTRKIAGKYYDVICDDEGLLKENPVPTMFDVDEKPMLCGNLIIAGFADDEGNLTDLSDEDIDKIMKKIRIVIFNDGSQSICLVDCEY